MLLFVRRNTNIFHTLSHFTSVPVSNLFRNHCFHHISFTLKLALKYWTPTLHDCEFRCLFCRISCVWTDLEEHIKRFWRLHYNHVIMSVMVSQITSITSIYSTVYPGSDQRKHQSSASLAFVRGIHRWPVNSPHKGPVTRKCFHLMTSSWKHL